MEIRETILKEVRVYKLILNDMRSPKIEMSEIVALSTDYQKLVDWYTSQIAPEGWRDGQWYKSFAEGSPLEWYNPASSLELNANYPFGQGISDEWITEDILINGISRYLYID